MLVAPLALALLLATAPPKAAPLPDAGREVEFVLDTPDGMTLRGSLHRPLEADASARLPAVVALHPVGKSREYSEQVVSELLARGFAVLSVDLRGHGQSRVYRQFYVKSFPNLGPESFRAMVDDQSLLADWLVARTDVDPSRLAVAGAGFAALIAAEAAGADQRFRAAALVAPSRPGPGVDGDGGLRRLGARPAWIATLSTNTEWLERARGLATLGEGPRDLRVFEEAAARAWEMYAIPAVASELAAWLAARLAVESP